MSPADRQYAWLTVDNTSLRVEGLREHVAPASKIRTSAQRCSSASRQATVNAGEVT